MTTVDAIQNPEATLIDVREPLELETDGAVEGAINIPLGDVPHEVEEIKEMNQPIVVFCRSGKRSARAMDFLKDQGINEVFNGGGFADVQEILNEQKD